MDSPPDSEGQPADSGPRPSRASGPISRAAISTPMSIADPPRPERIAARSRIDRRVIVAAVAVLGLAMIVGFVVVRALAAKPRVAYGVAAIADGEAVFLTRRGEGSSRAYAVQLVRSTGGLEWSSDVSPLEPFEASGFTGAVASEEFVVLIGARDGGTAVEAFSRKTGENVWATLVVGDVASARPAPMLFLDGPRVYAVHGKPDPVGGAGRGAITALDLESGKALWTLDLPSLDVPVARLDQDRLLVGSGAGIDLVDGASGAVKRATPMTQIACETPRGVVGFDANRRVTLYSRPGMSGDSTASVTEIDRNASRGPCGVHGDDIVFSVVKDGKRGLMRIEPTTGKFRWLVELGHVELGASETTNGLLPRLLPVVVTRRGNDDGATAVVVVDLEDGKIVSEHPTDARSVVLSQPTRGWITAGTVIAALDPSTGDVAASTAYLQLLQRGVVPRRDDARFGVLWIFGDELRRPGDLPWIAIDLGGARTLHTNGGVASTDVTSLGFP